MHLSQIIFHACDVRPPLPQFSQLPIAVEVARKIAQHLQQPDVALLRSGRSSGALQSR